MLLVWLNIKLICVCVCAFAGRPGPYREFLGRLALKSQATVLSVDYRRSPEHPYPAGPEDCLNAYLWLIKTKKVPSSRIVLAGDSAGGALTAEVLVRIRDGKHPQPAGGILISPWVDFSSAFKYPCGELNRKYDVLGVKMDHVVKWYLGDRTIESVAPLFRPLEGLAPMLIEVGDSELFRDQVLAFYNRALEAGVNVVCNNYEDMIHDFQIFFMFSRMPSITLSLKNMANFVIQQTDASVTTATASKKETYVFHRRIL